MGPFLLNLTILCLLPVCACMYVCVRGWQAGRKRIGCAYSLSDLFHSASCIKMGNDKRRSIYFLWEIDKNTRKHHIQAASERSALSQ